VDRHPALEDDPPEAADQARRLDRRAISHEGAAPKGRRRAALRTSAALSSRSSSAAPTSLARLTISSHNFSCAAAVIAYMYPAGRNQASIACCRQKSPIPLMLEAMARQALTAGWGP